jgi:hypothetical protein
MACADISSHSRYMAAYFDYTPTATEKVLFGTDFQDTDYTYFDDDEFLAGVMSITGGSSTTPDAYIYQNGFALWDNNTVIWAPQTYNEDVEDDYYQRIVGDGSYFKFYGRIQRDDVNDKNVFKCWNYASEWAHERDICTAYTWPFDSPVSTDNYIIGKYTIPDSEPIINLQYFQTGVEGWVDETNWMVRIDSMCYYNGSDWEYKPGKAIRGATNLITTDMVSGAWPICGVTYTNVEKYSSGSGWVIWMYDNSTQSDNSVLWSTSGTMYANAYSPWN